MEMQSPSWLQSLDKGNEGAKNEIERIFAWRIAD